MSETDDPMRTAQRLMRAELPKRFYREVAVARTADGAFTVTLDGRTARTPQRAPLAVPSQAAAERVAQEWRAQRDVIDPASMPATRLVASAIDAVAADAASVRAEIVKYAGSDLVCYRAGEPEGLVARQAAAWDPVLDWARSVLEARFVLVEGVTFAEQPPHTLASLAARLAPLDAFALAAVHVMTTLSGSALIATMVADGAITAGDAWRAAHVDEDWNIERWGADDEASARREARRREFEAAADLAAALRTAG